MGRIFMNEFLKSDLYRYSGKKSIKSFLDCYRKEAGFRFSVAYMAYKSNG